MDAKSTGPFFVVRGSVKRDADSLRISMHGTRILANPSIRAPSRSVIVEPPPSPKATAGKPSPERRATSDEPRTTDHGYDSVTYVAFIRAINVAGHASLKMTDARDAFAAAGCRNVRTYIQSGNVLFECPAREVTATLRAVKRRLADARAGEPIILWRSEQQLEEIVRRAPFTAPRRRADGQTLCCVSRSRASRQAPVPCALAERGAGGCRR